MRLACATALCASFLGAAAPAGADANPQALATSRTHLVRTRPRVAPGLETAMPRTAIYGAAVALDLEERFEESAERYREAEAEFGRMPATAVPGGAATQMAWQRKARWQAQWSLQLGLRGRGLRAYGAYATGELGYTYMLKFLAARAFTGRPSARLAGRARTLFEESLRQDPGNLPARLSYATLLQELGEPLTAQRELARAAVALARDEASAALRLSAYLAAAGDRARAVEALERVYRRSPYARWGAPDILRWSNEYDRLRDDPRFKRLLESAGTPRWWY
ncbi:MAG TPA: hypothetical protein VGQ83_14145 [Polyangia bacterium]|jgi:tetratricopeptide (TPR) repeat protein